jgi:hypothetical protein
MYTITKAIKSTDVKLRFIHEKLAEMRETIRKISDNQLITEGSIPNKAKTVKFLQDVRNLNLTLQSDCEGLGNQEFNDTQANKLYARWLALSSAITNAEANNQFHDLPNNPIYLGKVEERNGYRIQLDKLIVEGWSEPVIE